MIDSMLDGSWWVKMLAAYVLWFSLGTLVVYNLDRFDRFLWRIFGKPRQSPKWEHPIGKNSLGSEDPYHHQAPRSDERES